jgi:hypothetical protein
MGVYKGIAQDNVTITSGNAALQTLTVTGAVSLTGTVSITDNVLSKRTRFTVAQVNAGATIVPAVTGKAIRVVGTKVIAIGGAAGAVTTVDIIGTQTTAAKLVAFAQANLTRSTVLTDGGTGATVLADGASYVANDVGTAVTIGKTGSDVTTATHIDVIFDYVLV